MKYFGTQTYYLLDKSKPYQRPELRHAGPTSVNREAELETPSRVACSDLLGDIFVLSLSLCQHMTYEHNTAYRTQNIINHEKYAIDYRGSEIILSGRHRVKSEKIPSRHQDDAKRAGPNPESKCPQLGATIG